MDNPEVKTGMRNSLEDRARIRNIRRAARDIQGITTELEPEDNDPLPEQSEVTSTPVLAEKAFDISDASQVEDTLVVYGSEVKSLEGGKLGGYLVRFTSPDSPDLTGDYFTKDTDFGSHKSTEVFYNHALDVKLGGRVIGQGTLSQDEIGVWIEAQLSERDEYEKYILEMAKSGKLGWSSGTASHLVERKPEGKANRITRWKLGLDASLTPTPAEPRNAVVTLKSLIIPPAITQDVTLEAGSQPAAEQTETPAGEVKEPIKSKGNTKMEDAEIKSMITEAVDTAVTAFKASLPAVQTGGVQIVSNEKPFKTFGHQLQAIARAETKTANEEDMNRLSAVKATGLSENIPSDGGFLVQQDFISEIVKPSYETGAVLSRVDSMSVSGNGLKFNVVDETSRATGSRYGGVQGYWLSEAGTKSATKPKFRQVDLQLKKVIGLFYATDELLQDATALAALGTEAMTNELRYLVEESIVRGDGAGKPQGWLNSGSLVSVAIETGQAADTILAENTFKMYSRMPGNLRPGAVWYINQDIEPQLFGMCLAVGTGGIPVYLPANGLSGSPYGSLYGRPVIPIEYASTLGDVGDIMFVAPREYKFIEKGGIQSASSIHVQFVTDETAFRFVFRCDGCSKWYSSVTPSQGSAIQSPFIALAARA